MAGKEQKQGRKISFELSWGGIAGVTVVCFCICIWMFLLGVWTGQSLLQPSSYGRKKASKEASALIAPFVRAERNRDKDSQGQ